MHVFAKQSEVWRDFFSAMAESWKKLKTSNLFSSFIVSSNRNRPALVRELRARDLIFFTTDLQTGIITQFTARADLFLKCSLDLLDFDL